MARSRRLPQVGRTVSPRRGAQPPGQPPAPPPLPGPSPGKSQGPAHGQGIGIGLFLLSTGRNPGQGGVVPQPAFPHTPILDTFNRPDSSTSLGPNWDRLNPGGFLGYSTQQLGVSSNQGYDPDTSSNVATSYYTPTTFSGSAEAYFTIGTPSPNLGGVALRAQNVNGIAVKYYLVSTAVGNVSIQRQDSQSSATTLQGGALTGGALVAGDKLGGRIRDSGGNVILELWVFRASTSLWSMASTVTDSSASKITGAGNIGIVWGNLSGQTAARFDNFGGGAS